MDLKEKRHRQSGVPDDNGNGDDLDELPEYSECGRGGAPNHQHHHHHRNRFANCGRAVDDSSMRISGGCERRRDDQHTTDDGDGDSSWSTLGQGERNYAFGTCFRGGSVFSLMWFSVRTFKGPEFYVVFFLLMTAEATPSVVSGDNDGGR